MKQALLLLLAVVMVSLSSMSGAQSETPLEATDRATEELLPPAGDAPLSFDLRPVDGQPLPSLGPQRSKKNPKQSVLVPSRSRGLVSACSYETSDFDIFCSIDEGELSGWCCGSVGPCLEFCEALCDEICAYVE